MSDIILDVQMTMPEKMKEFLDGQLRLLRMDKPHASLGDVIVLILRASMIRQPAPGGAGQPPFQPRGF